MNVGIATPRLGKQMTGTAWAESRQSTSPRHQRQWLVAQKTHE